jgi:hypothetical protein
MKSITRFVTAVVAVGPCSQEGYIERQCRPLHNRGLLLDHEIFSKDRQERMALLQRRSGRTSKLSGMFVTPREPRLQESLGADIVLQSS